MPLRNHRDQTKLDVPLAILRRMSFTSENLSEVILMILKTGPSVQTLLLLKNILFLTIRIIQGGTLQQVNPDRQTILQASVQSSVPKPRDPLFAGRKRWNIKILDRTAGLDHIRINQITQEQRSRLRGLHPKEKIPGSDLERHPRSMPGKNATLSGLHPKEKTPTSDLEHHPLLNNLHVRSQLRGRITTSSPAMRKINWRNLKQKWRSCNQAQASKNCPRRQGTRQLAQN
jgi:hypothetical protein